MEKPNWINTFLALAETISQRSHDSQTQHGAVICNKKNRILGLGLNGFPRDMPDARMIEEGFHQRPKKYPVMIHAEINAIENCSRKPEGGILYVTGRPCNKCIVQIKNVGIKKIFYAKGHATFNKEDFDEEFFNYFVQLSGLIVEEINPDYDWAIARLRAKNGVKLPV